MLNIKNYIKDINAIKPFIYYFFSNIFFQMLNFGMLLLALSFMDISQYSLFTMNKFLIILTVAIAGLGVSQALIRFYDDGIPLSKLCPTAFLIIFISTIFFSIIAYGFIYFNREIFAEDISPIIFLLIFFCILASGINNEHLNLLRLERKEKQYLYFSMFRFLISITLFYILLLNNSNYMQYLWAIFIAEISLAIFSFTKNNLYSNFSAVRLDYIYKIFNYGWPQSLIISSVVAINFTDRYILILSGGSDLELRFFDVTTTVFLAIFSLITRPFNLYLFPRYSRLYSIKKFIPLKKLLSKASLSLFIIFMLITIILSIFMPIFSHYFPETNSFISISLLPIISIIGFCLGLMIISYSYYYLHGNTKDLAFISIISVVINTILNFYFYKWFGLEGILISTVIAYIVVLLYTDLRRSDCWWIPRPYLFLFSFSLFVVVIYKFI